MKRERTAQTKEREKGNFSKKSEIAYHVARGIAGVG